MRHSMAIGEQARRGGATCRLGTVSSPSAATSLSPDANSAELACIDESVASVATLTTNWPVAAMLAAVSFSDSPRRPMFTSSIGGRLQTKV